MVSRTVSKEEQKMPMSFSLPTDGDNSEIIVTASQVEPALKDPLSSEELPCTPQRSCSSPTNVVPDLIIPLLLLPEEASEQHLTNCADSSSSCSSMATRDNSTESTSGSAGRSPVRNVADILLTEDDDSPTTPVRSLMPSSHSFRDPFPTPTPKPSKQDLNDWLSNGSSYLMVPGQSLFQKFAHNDDGDGDSADEGKTIEDHPTSTSTTSAPMLRRRRQRFLPLQSERAAKALRSSIQTTSQRLQNTSTRIRGQFKFSNKRQTSPWLIPADHPLKVVWDISTVCISLVSAYVTHTSIRERDYDPSGFLIRFCEIWFFLDILLNFVTEHRFSAGNNNNNNKNSSGGPQKVWARYLTSWFIIDVISFIPWEKIWVKPIVEMQKRRNLLQKTGRRSKVVLKIGRMLRGRHIRWFQNLTRWTKPAGYNGSKLLALIIKYIPKYFMFIKNMKAVLAVRMLRQINWVRKVMNHLSWKKKQDDSEGGDDGDAEEDERIDETFCEDSVETDGDTVNETFDTNSFDIEQLDHDDDPYEPKFC